MLKEVLSKDQLDLLTPKYKDSLSANYFIYVQDLLYRDKDKESYQFSTKNRESLFLLKLVVYLYLKSYYLK